MTRIARPGAQPPRKSKGLEGLKRLKGHARVSGAPSVALVQEQAPARLDLDDDSIGLEARMSAGDHQSLRLWLRLLSCSTDIETEIRKRLRTRFGMTLARFDYLAQLHRHPDGLRMNVLSRYLMVTGGNVTGLTDELEKEGFVTREADPDDRRSWRVALTPKGRKAFEGIASVHESWVIELFGGMADADKWQLHDLLGRLRMQLSARPAAQHAADAPHSRIKETTT